MKQFSKFFAVCALSACATAFVACSDDGEDFTGDDPVTKVTTPVVEYGFSVTDDVLAVADLVVTYMNVGGVEATDTLTTGEWELTFTPTSSQKVGFKVTAAPKAGIDSLLTKDRYTLGSGYHYLSYQRDSQGKTSELEGSVANPDENDITIAADQVKDFFNGKATTVCKSRSAYYDKDKNEFTEWEFTY